MHQYNTMKKLLLLLLIAPVLGLGQIGKSSSLSDEKQEIGSVNLWNAMGTVNGKAKLTKAYGKYLLSFQDQNFQKISKIIIVEFTATDEELDYLFNELKSAFKSSNEEFRIEVGNATLIYNMYRKKEMKITAILKNGEKGYFGTNAAALHILFGKKWDKKAWKNYLIN
jgi:hypothetical protein